MKHCHSCGHLIEGEAVEITPFSDSGAKPTLWRHPTPGACRAAVALFNGTPLRSRIRRR